MDLAQSRAVPPRRAGRAGPRRASSAPSTRCGSASSAASPARRLAVSTSGHPSTGAGAAASSTSGFTGGRGGGGVGFVGHATTIGAADPPATTRRPGAADRRGPAAQRAQRPSPASVTPGGTRPAVPRPGVPAHRGTGTARGHGRVGRPSTPRCARRSRSGPPPRRCDSASISGKSAAANIFLASSVRMLVSVMPGLTVFAVMPSVAQRSARRCG